MTLTRAIKKIMPMAGNGTLLIPGILPWELSAFRKRLSLRDSSLSGVSSAGASSPGDGSATVREAIGGFDCGAWYKCHRPWVCRSWREKAMSSVFSGADARTVMVPVGKNVQVEDVRKEWGHSAPRLERQLPITNLQRYGGKKRVMARLWKIIVIVYGNIALVLSLLQ
jgi:hypothetical protein